MDADDLARAARLEAMLVEPGLLPKARWGRGPWQREPDYCAWRYAGFHCAAARSMDMGHWSAYVGVPGDHPLFGKPHDECVGSCEPESLFCGHRPSDLIDVVSGITWSGPLSWGPETLWWFGFHYARAWDYMPAIETITALLHPEFHALRRDLYREAGWHARYRSLRFVRRQANHVAVQLRVRPTHAPRWPWPTVVAAVLGER